MRTQAFEKISEKTKKTPDVWELYNALYFLCKEETDVDKKWAMCKKLRAICNAEVLRGNPLSERLNKLYRETLLLEAQFQRFDSYMLYLELNREPSKRFWLPRREQLMPVAEAIQDLIDDKLDILTISLPPGSGKALADGTPVLTKKGWKKHGDLVVGDYVISPNGNFVKVIAVHPKCEMEYRLITTDGEEIICHGNHEWVVYNRHRMKQETLKTTDMLGLIDNPEIVGRGHRYHYMLPNVEPLVGEHKDLMVEPYVLGAWLGDGRNNNPDICGSKEDVQIIVAEFEKAGYSISWNTTHKTTGVLYYGFKGLRKDLQSFGMCHSRRKTDKHIPDEYFTASVEQRLRLLAGLIDTDGCKLSDKNGYSFSTAETRLKDDFVRLVSTFGWKCSVKEEAPHTSTSGIVGRRSCYTVKFMPTMYVPCLLERKQLNEFSKQRRKAIKSIEPIKGVEGNCITVENGVYCVGDRMIPTHNSTLEIFLHSMLIGANPDRPSLASGHSNILTNSIYEGVLGIINDKEEYLWHDVFPDWKEPITNAKEQTIDLEKKHRFSSLTCRAIGASLTGATRCEQILTADDLVSGIEEALSVERLDKLWQAYTNDLKSRKKLGCKELHLATRWSVHDPIGRLERMYGDNPRFKCLVIPALDENGESNFNYKYGVGFDTKYFEDMRENLDECSFKALFMNEPIEREGLLYSEQELRRYYELPDEEPEAIIAVCDTKDKGTDYWVQLVGYKYGEDYYIDDVICDNSLPEVVDARLIECLLRNNVQMANYESNNAGGRVAKDVQQAVKERGGRTKITTKFTTSNKQTKIIVNSAWVKDHCLFKAKESYTRQSDYGKFIAMMCSYTMAGKNKNDDAPDAISMFAEYAQSFIQRRVEVFKRFI